MIENRKKGGATMTTAMTMMQSISRRRRRRRRSGQFSDGVKVRSVCSFGIAGDRTGSSISLLRSRDDTRTREALAYKKRPLTVLICFMINQLIQVVQKSVQFDAYPLGVSTVTRRKVRKNYGSCTAVIINFTPEWFWVTIHGLWNYDSPK